MTQLLILHVICVAIGFGVMVEVVVMMLVEVSQFGITVIIIACSGGTTGSTTTTSSTIDISGLIGTAMHRLGSVTWAVVVVMLVRHARLLKLGTVPVRLQLMVVQMGMLGARPAVGHVV